VVESVFVSARPSGSSCGVPLEQAPGITLGDSEVGAFAFAAAFVDFSVAVPSEVACTR
jgi:hypothetical protein